ncbi:MAG: galactose oxidase-like domain-containing protein [Pedococcus sp.]
MLKSSWFVGVLSAAALVGSSVAPQAGAAAPAQSAAVDASLGSWSAPFTPSGASTRVVGVHSVQLYTGKVLTFGALRPTQGYVWDPATGKATETDPPADVECGSTTALQDGRILVVGGHAKGARGINNILLFDPVGLTWTPQPASVTGRYYPTTTLLPNGSVLISGGFDINGAKNPNMELWTPPPTGQNVGTLQRVGGLHPSGLYPHQWVLPNGKILEVTSSTTAILDPSTWTWTTYAKPKMKHGSGEGAVLLPGPASGSTKVMLMGGNVAGVATTAVETFDAASPTAGWSALAPLPQGRTHMSPVLMPDGSVVGVGGNSSGNFTGPLYTALRYTPSSNSWETLAPQAMRRGYHSSAVLLPDGRVFSAGDTGVGGGGNTDEVFSPPYLSAQSPTITSAPSQVAHGETFTIETPDTTSKAVLIRTGAATHTINFDERIVTLSTTAAASGLTAVSPSATVGVAGWYMLFIVKGAGVPSTAKWIHIG